jgi:hypothetical protein
MTEANLGCLENTVVGIVEVLQGMLQKVEEGILQGLSVRTVKLIGDGMKNARVGQQSVRAVDDLHGLSFTRSF